MAFIPPAKDKWDFCQRVLKSGGEGVVYHTDTPTLAKIYQRKDGTISAPGYMPSKLKILMEVKTKKQVCMPTYILENQQGECVGFLMPQAEGIILQNILGGPKDVKQHIPTWRMKDLASLCISFLSTIQGLHKKGVLVGDINPHNLLFTPNAEMFFIDCDSYQIKQFPCLVGTPEYLPPGHHGKQFSEFLRSKSDEYYAIACLLFVILSLGRHPYDSKGSKRDQCVKDGRFPYPINKGDSSLVPNENAKRRWEALSPKLQEYFHGSFQKGGKYYAPKKRISPPKWISALQDFKQQPNG